jgi:surfeit locus 1 family protein
VNFKVRHAAAATGAFVFFCGFLALGTWQLERRVWKLDLIARVNERVHAPPVAAPPLPEWPRVSRARDEYRHVAATGVFLDESETLVQAVTVLGPGFWVLTPLQLADGALILVNRGFVPSEGSDGHGTGAARDPSGGGHGMGAAHDPSGDSPGHGSGPGRVTGLLRMTEPKGGFLRHNDAAADRWYSRDVQAIAAARHLKRVAPYFIDADAQSAALEPGAPVGGLTVIDFHNNHLLYAITWYTLALMIPAALWFARKAL